MTLPAPHGDKLAALLQNDKLPTADRKRIEKAVKEYCAWLGSLTRIPTGNGALAEAVPLRVAGHDPDQHGGNGCRRSAHPPKGEEAWIAGPQCIRDAGGARLPAGRLCEIPRRASIRA